MIETAVMRSLAIPLCVLVLVGGLQVGCEGEEGGEPERPAESGDPLPRLPRDWKRDVNRRAGLAIGVPPRWSVRDRRRSSLFRSPDLFVAVSVSADRSREALAVPLEEFASRVADALRGFKRLRTGWPRPFRARYEAVALPGSGQSAKGDVPQNLLVVVERNEGVATYTVLIARNARAGSRSHREEVSRMVRSLRSRPVR
jgi:hypothetical protein